jgi:hypothetical protein
VRECAETIARVLARQALYRANIDAHPELLRECTWEEQGRKILDVYAMLDGSSLPHRAAKDTVDLAPI